MITRIETDDAIIAVFFESEADAKENYLKMKQVWIGEMVLFGMMIAFPFVSNRIH
jgi:hypothetical protein